MKKVSLLILGLALSLFASTGLYATDANVYVTNYMNLEFDGLVKSVEKLSQSSLTVTKAKSLRYDISKIRLFIDVFSYAYPTRPHASMMEKYPTIAEQIGKTDLLLAFREKLDDGYDVLGSYKDHMEAVDKRLITSALQAKLRQDILNWKDAFLNGTANLPIPLAVYSDFLKTTPQNVVTVRAKNKLPKWTWRYVNYYPVNGESVETVLSKLSYDLVERAKIEYQNVVDTVLVLPTEENNETFHNFRKRVRTIYKIMKDIGGYYRVNLESLYLQQMLNTTSDKYGSLHDVIVTHEFSKELGATDAFLNAKEQEIQSGWETLKAWQGPRLMGWLTLVNQKYFSK